MTPQEQTRVLIQAMRDELDRINNMSEAEAYEDARQNLQDVGIIDSDGNITERYAGVLVRAE